MEEFLNFYRNQNFQNDTIENYRRDFTEFMRLFIRRWYSEIEENQTSHSRGVENYSKNHQNSEKINLLLKE